MVAVTPLIQERRYTVEEFRQICQLPENETKRLELIDGVIVEMSSSSKRNTIIAGLIIYYLNAFVIPRGIGFVSVPDGGYHLGDGNVRQPDVAFITKARSEGLDGVEFPVAPDLAVEVLSSSESLRAVLKKVQAYLVSGGRLVWAVDPDEQVVDVYQLAPNGGLNVQTFGLDAHLDGGDVLPGFTLAVRDIFPKE